ncbi:MAG: 16S rRNA (guanine(966)-N(2))-methyltransferase RsmD [Oleispira sp.]|nr:16S rRNA (guanine(966)-N(2))-methyltransferase RsmD [Oleispira sp.]MBL4881213.1 16S rRNA (guanine(966)-N(2))-methyltransferase RsmD [Oleispira sp.]
MAKKSNQRKGPQQLRIIGGDWRSRRIHFADAPGLRPTMDKVRETVFNWLQWDIEGKLILDCFAGSGALGYEALSRGAKEVTFIELNKNAASCIRDSLVSLEASNAQVFQADALTWLGQQESLEQFGVIFLDPPFAKELLAPTVELIASKVKTGCLVYVEVEAKADLSCIPSNWLESKRKDGKEFSFMLFEVE